MKQHLFALFCLLLSATLAGEPSSSKFGTLAVGSAVPEFRVLDENDRELAPAARANAVLVLSIMGTNRSPGDALESVFTKFRADGVTVLAVCAGATREEFTAWREKHKGAVSYPLARDPAAKNRNESLAQKIFGVGAYPMTVVIDRAGKLMGGFVGFGPASGAVLRGLLRDAGVPVPPEETPQAAAPPPREDRTLKPGTRAPDFEAVDLGGKGVKLSDFAGKIVVLDFWATWCGPCIASMPHNQQVAAATKSQGVKVFAACTSDTRANFEAWLQAHGTAYPDVVFANDPIGRDGPPEKYEERVSAKLYGVSGIPCQFVIDRNGHIAEVIVGYGPNDNRLEQALEKLGVKLEP